jgi:putative transposase
MPRRPRSSLPVSFFHVINRGVRKLPIFTRPVEYRAFLNVLAGGLERYPVRLLSYCVLSNHWHLVIDTGTTATLSRFVKWVSATHAIRWHHRHKTVGQGALYQGRFRAIPIEHGAQLVRVCRYVERNALSATLVRRSQDWPWCSLSQRLRLDTRVPLATAPFLASAAWTDHVNADQPDQDPIEQLLWELDDRPNGSLRRETKTKPTSGTELLKPVEKSPVPLPHFADDPGVVAGVGETGEDGVGVGGGADEDQADPHVENAEHLGVADAAGALEPGKQRRRRPAGPVQREAAPLRKRARQILRNAPAGDVRHALDRSGYE